MIKKHIEPPAPQTILSLDTATKCGWAIWHNGSIVSSGVWNFNSKTIGRKLTKFASQLTKIIVSYNVTEIVAEDIYLDASRPKAFMRLGEMRGVLLAVAEQHNIAVNFIEPSQHKRYLCCSSYATKTETQTTLQRLGYGEISSNDEADAIAILLTYIKAPIRLHKPRKR